jgi:hypothetical protein
MWPAWNMSQAPATYTTRSLGFGTCHGKVEDTKVCIRRTQRMRAHEQTVCACAINVVKSPITLCQPRLLAHKRHSTTSTELFTIGHIAGAL